MKTRHFVRMKISINDGRVYCEDSCDDTDLYN